jgi:hypothetical protein
MSSSLFFCHCLWRLEYHTDTTKLHMLLLLPFVVSHSKHSQGRDHPSISFTSLAFSLSLCSFEWTDAAVHVVHLLAAAFERRRQSEKHTRGKAMPLSSFIVSSFVLKVLFVSPLRCRLWTQPPSQTVRTHKHPKSKRWGDGSKVKKVWKCV